MCVCVCAFVCACVCIHHWCVCVRNITIPISPAVIVRAIHSTLSAGVDIEFVFFRQSSHFDVLLTLTVFSFRSSLHGSFPVLLVIPTFCFIFKCFYCAYNYMYEYFLVY